MKINFIFILHLAIVMSVVLLPLFSVEVLRYAVYVPALLALSWVVFDGCVLTKQQSDIADTESFAYKLLQKVFPTITTKRADSVVTLIVVASTLFASKKLGKF